MDDRMKWRASFFLWAVTVGWFVFLITWFSRCDVSLIEATGAGIVGGALVTWSGLVVQYWFRKAKSNVG